MEENPKANNQIEEINVVLNELKDGQELLSSQSQKNFKEIMKKLMTNQVFEMRLSNIEDFLFRLEGYIRNNK